jgi:hypothetical protein
MRPPLPKLALFGHGAMSDLSPLCEAKRTWTDSRSGFFSGLIAGRGGRADVPRQSSPVMLAPFSKIAKC